MEAEKEPKSDQELAFLRDLYVMPDWGERFATLIDDNIQLPKKGRILYVQSGTGGHAMAIQEVLDSDAQLVCVDESNECLELARAKAMAVHGETDFRQSPANDLPFDFDDFDLVIGDLSLIPPLRLPAIVKEATRVAKPGASVALAAVTAGSFGEFFSIYWEAMANVGLAHDTAIFDELITVIPTVSAVEEQAEAAGLGDILSRTNPEEFEFESGGAFLNSPLVTEFLLPAWLAPVPAAERDKVLAEIAKVIDEERHEADFVMSVKATFVAGKKRVSGAGRQVSGS